MTTKRHLLSADEFSHYQQQGFVVRTAVLTQHECDHWTEVSDSAERLALAQVATDRGAKEYQLDNNRFVDVEHVTLQFEHLSDATRLRVIEPVCDIEPRFDALIDDERLTHPMQQLVGSESLALWTAKLNLKHAGIGSGFGWHQDAPYWIHDSQHVQRLPNVMVLFDEARENNGCLRIIRGSHQQGCLPGCEDGRQLQGFYTDPRCFSVDDQVAMTAPAGSLVFFDPFCIHGSGPNLSVDARKAVIITYQPAGFITLKSKLLRSIAS